MNTKKKISLLFTGAALLYVIAFVVFELIQQHQHNLLYSSSHQILDQSINASFKTKTSSMTNVVYDYTNWDDMISYVDTHDSTWANDNLASILQSHKMNIVWVYNLNREPVYCINNCSPEENKLIALAGDIFLRLKKEKSLTFYLRIPEGIFLVSGAPIHHTNDLDRVQAYHGYFFIAKSLDKGFLEEISALTGSTVLQSDSTNVKSVPGNIVNVSYPLHDWREREIASLVINKDYPFLNDFFVFSRITRLLFIGIGLLVILVFFALFSHWVSRPLAKINYGLLTGDISGIEELKKRPDEFGHLSQLLENFIIQKKQNEKQIIERIKTEKLLLESEEKFSKAFLFSPAAMMISSLDTRQIITVNESFSRMTGLGLKELLGQTIDETGVFQDPRVFTMIADTLDREHTVKAHDIFLTTNTGELRFGMLKCDIVFLQGNRCLLSVIIDITERKQVEMAMKMAREKAEESDRLKYFLLMNMSHEMRTPLTGIIGFAEVIRDESRETHVQALADKVLLSGDRLLRTLNSIMLLAEIQSGNLSIHKQKYKLGHCVPAVIKEFGTSAKAKSLEISLQDEGTEAEVDPAHFQQIVHCLLDNAIKFSDAGSVNLSVYSEILPDKKWAVLEVRDTGIGIPQEKQKEIFQEFRQASEGVGRSFEGSGLGLSIAKNLTSIMGGEIALVSKEDVGSTFYIRFPLYV